MADRVPKQKHRRRALVWPLIVLASVVLIFSITANWVQTRGPEHGQRGRTRPTRSSRTRTYSRRSALHGRSAVRQRRRPGPDPAGAAERRPALAVPVAAATRQLGSERRRASARIASGSGPRLHGRPLGRNEQFLSLIKNKRSIRLDHGRQRHARVREPRRRPRRPPWGEPSDDLQDPGPRPELTRRPPAAPDHGSGPDRLGAGGRSPRLQGGTLSPGAATGSPDAPCETPPSSRRRSPSSRRRSRA